MQCPRCNKRTLKQIIEIYGRCLRCEDEFRKKNKFPDSRLFIRPENIEMLIFFNKILGKAKLSNGTGI
jgi:hypothetical protein